MNGIFNGLKRHFCEDGDFPSIPLFPTEESSDDAESGERQEDDE